MIRRQYKMVGDVSQIEAQARQIRDIAQSIIEACQHGKAIDAYARNKVAGGSLAQDAAVLGIMIVQYEMEDKQ